MINTRKQRVRIESVFSYVIFTLFMVIVLFNKTNYNIDEIFSYGLANNMNGMVMNFEDGLSYIPAQAPWLSYMTVSNGSQFELPHIWINQAEDVHPPFYYLLLHIVCSFFPGKFSIWFAGGINIVFALLTLWVLRRLAYELTDCHYTVGIVSLYFAISAGILSSVSFL